jgi:hypothetical protein
MSTIARLFLVMMVFVPATISIDAGSNRTAAAADGWSAYADDVTVVVQEEADAEDSEDLPWPLFVAGAFLVPAAFLLIPSLVLKGDASGH